MSGVGTGWDARGGESRGGGGGVGLSGGRAEHTVNPRFNKIYEMQ